MIDHIIEGMIEEELEAEYLRQEKLSEKYEKGRIGMVPKFRVFEKERKITCEVEELVFKENGDLRQVSYYWEDYGEYLTTTSPDELILMQSTGLIDKNGTEIFEGDVVINSDWEIGEVTYLTQEAGFVVKLKNRDYRLGHRNTGEQYAEANEHTVIGHIYESREVNVAR